MKRLAEMMIVLSLMAIAASAIWSNYSNYRATVQAERERRAKEAWDSYEHCVESFNTTIALGYATPETYKARQECTCLLSTQTDSCLGVQKSRLE